MPNNTFAITFSAYEFLLDRDRRVYRLVETRTNTIWADGLSAGWVALEDRVTGGVSRYDFGNMTLTSLSERGGPRGKEILLGLDCQGIPVDLYVTCAEREIQITVEANRDSRTHRVAEVCLLPGLCRVPDGDTAHLVVPNREGAILRARDVPGEPAFLPIWETDGLSMPFFGAVRGDAVLGDASSNGRSALALITDSAYGALRLARDGAGATLDAHYRRDPERRRLELRVVPLPGGDAVAIARAYRDKIVAMRQHVLLRRKARDRPAADALLGGALVSFPARISFADAVEIARDLRDSLSVDRAVCLFESETSDAAVMREAAAAIRDLGFRVGIRAGHDHETSTDLLATLRRVLPKYSENVPLDAVFLDAVCAGFDTPLSEETIAEDSRWDDIDRRMEIIALVHEHAVIFGASGGMDWSSVVSEVWEGVLPDPYDPLEAFAGARVPLYAAVYHDSVVGAFSPGHPLQPDKPRRFLRALRSLSPPAYTLDKTAYDDPSTGLREYVRQTFAVLAPLHRLTFPAFLVAHRFLTDDFAVEEARYSDGTRVVINSAETVFENAEMALPPLGFWAAHAQFTAHDALRIGAETFPTRAWRIVRTPDGDTGELVPGR